MNFMVNTNGLTNNGCVFVVKLLFFLLLPIGGRFGRSSREPKYKVEFHAEHSPFHPVSMLYGFKLYLFHPVHSFLYPLSMLDGL